MVALLTAFTQESNPGVVIAGVLPSAHTTGCDIHVLTVLGGASVSIVVVVRTASSAWAHLFVPMVSQNQCA